MTTPSRAWRAGGPALLILLAAGGCGLKGPLQPPAKSTNVVIRGPEPAASPAGEPSTRPEASPGTALPAEEEEERLPPPPLPEGGNPGPARGG